MIYAIAENCNHKRQKISHCRLGTCHTAMRVITVNGLEIEMKKTVMKEVTLCDCCQEEGYLTACINCKVEHCHDCTKTEGKTYVQAINYARVSNY